MSLVSSLGITGLVTATTVLYLGPVAGLTAPVIGLALDQIGKWGQSQIIQDVSGPIFLAGILSIPGSIVG